MILNNELFCEQTTKQECKQDKWWGTQNVLPSRVNIVITIGNEMCKHCRKLLSVSHFYESQCILAGPKFSLS